MEIKDAETELNNWLSIAYAPICLNKRDKLVFDKLQAECDKYNATMADCETQLIDSLMEHVTMKTYTKV
jgi:hypothetical protein